jgi:hypothetical protein
MTITVRERAFGLYKDGCVTAIKKQLEVEGFDVPRGTIENLAAQGQMGWKGRRRGS